MFGYYKNKTQFLRQHAIYENMFLGNRTIKKIAGFKHEDKLENIWSQIATTKSADYFVDLPQTVDKFIDFKKF